MAAEDPWDDERLTKLHGLRQSQTGQEICDNLRKTFSGSDMLWFLDKILADPPYSDYEYNKFKLVADNFQWLSRAHVEESCARPASIN